MNINQIVINVLFCLWVRTSAGIRKCPKETVLLDWVLQSFNNRSIR